MSHQAQAYLILLAQLIVTLIHYPGHSQWPHLVQLTGLLFYRVSFADHMKSQLRQWGTTWEAGSKIELSGSEMSLRPSRHVWDYGWNFLDSWLIQTVITEGVACLQLSILPHHPSHPLPPTYPLIHNTPVTVKKVVQDPAVLASWQKQLHCIATFSQKVSLTVSIQASHSIVTLEPQRLSSITFIRICINARNGNLSYAFIEFCKADCIFKLHTRSFSNY